MRAATAATMAGKSSHSGDSPGSKVNRLTVARTGRAAADLIQQEAYHLVLMDLGMPKLDGYGAARHIRGQPWGQQMMLIALSGWGQDGHKQRAKEAGFDHHLVKPADPAQLQRLLASAKQPLKHHAAPL